MEGWEVPPAGVQRERVQRLNDAALCMESDTARSVVAASPDVNPTADERRYVLLWVQQDPREDCNHALEYAAQVANRLRLPLRAVFGLYEHFPEANERCFAFLLHGLADLRGDLHRRGVALTVLRAPPPTAAIHLAKHAAVVVCDRGYPRLARAWRSEVARGVSCPVIMVETTVVVPVETASSELEHGAATLRPKLHRHLPRFLVDVPRVALTHSSVEATHSSSSAASPEALEEVDVADPERALASLDVDRSVAAVAQRGGAREAANALATFLTERLNNYSNGKGNDPSAQCSSRLSAYLHFGQLSPLRVALETKAWDHSRGVTGKASPTNHFLEELIVRRELARNFVWYCPEDYDGWQAIPGWARASLEEHADDARPSLLPLATLEKGETADRWWDAAQWEMLATGYMHNYMRMYWCKRLIEWTKDPRQAWQWAVYLNNKYQLDGRDENGYVGIAWCFGLHDRPFPTRQVWGDVRPMSAAGLTAKFAMHTYEHRVQQQCQQASSRVRALLGKRATAGNHSITSFFRRTTTTPRAATATASTKRALVDAVDATAAVKRVKERR